MTTSLPSAAPAQPKPTPPKVMPAAIKPTTIRPRFAANDPRFATIPDITPQQFIDANRIHVKDGSYFIDGNLVLHPRELDPKNETTLRQKLQLTYGLNAPSFFEDPKRAHIALNLAQIIPFKLTTKHESLMRAIEAYNKEADQGRDLTQEALINERKHPLQTVVNEVTAQENPDPMGVEMLKNGLGIFFLLREKLTQLRFTDPLKDYVNQLGSPDQVLYALGQKTGVSPLAMREAAAAEGLEGIGKVLGLTPAFVAEVRALTDHLANCDFSMNAVEHWHEGRRAAPTTTELGQRINAGMASRVEKDIQKFRDLAGDRYDVPEAIAQEEKRIAEALMLVTPAERALLFAQGTEICFTPDMHADDIAKYRGIYGLHRTNANSPNDVRATRRIYFSGREGELASLRTLVHEIRHNFAPGLFTPEEITAVDGLMQLDRERIDTLKYILTTHRTDLEKLAGAYAAGNAQEKQAVLEATNQKFAEYHVTFDAVLPHLKEGMVQFSAIIDEAHQRLNVEGGLFNRTGYHDTGSRFREMISRYSELRDVQYRGIPMLQTMLGFVVPGMSTAFEQYYLPHIERMHQTIAAGAQSFTLAATSDSPKIVDRPKAAACATHGDSCHGCLSHPPTSEVNAGHIDHAKIAPALSALKDMGVRAAL